MSDHKQDELYTRPYDCWPSHVDQLIYKTATGFLQIVPAFSFWANVSTVYVYVALAALILVLRCCCCGHRTASILPRRRSRPLHQRVADSSDLTTGDTTVNGIINLESAVIQGDAMCRLQRYHVARDARSRLRVIEATAVAAWSQEVMGRWLVSVIYLPQPFAALRRLHKTVTLPLSQKYEKQNAFMDTDNHFATVYGVRILQDSS
jgi:hypothetical protein